MAGRRANKCSNSSRIGRLLVLLAALICLVCEVQCQFFTKGNSKSIPRMGRRSSPDATNRLEIYRRMLIDRLVDEFGPELMAQLRPEIKFNTDAAAPSGAGGGEIVLRNEQPFDYNIKPEQAQQQQQQQQMFVLEPVQMASRDERSVAGPDGSVSRQSHKGAKSLAMRAFNADRLLQHLASGGSPLMSYDSQLIGEQKMPRSSGYD